MRPRSSASSASLMADAGVSRRHCPRMLAPRGCLLIAVQGYLRRDLGHAEPVRPTCPGPSASRCPPWASRGGDCAWLPSPPLAPADGPPPACNPASMIRDPACQIREHHIESCPRAVQGRSPASSFKVRAPQRHDRGRHIGSQGWLIQRFLPKEGIALAQCRRNVRFCDGGGNTHERPEACGGGALKSRLPINVSAMGQPTEF
jgi:hypothetical protein